MEKIKEFESNVGSKSRALFCMMSGPNWGAAYVSAMRNIAQYLLGENPVKLRYLLPCPKKDRMSFIEPNESTTSKEVVEALKRLKAHPKYEELIASGELWLPDEALQAIEEALHLKSATEGPSCEEEMKMFDLKNAEDIVRDHIKQYPLYSQAQIRMFDLKNAEDIIREYIKKYPLYPAAQLRMFDLKNAEDIVRGYIKKYSLSVPAQVKLFDLRNFEDIFIEYTKKESIHPFVEAKVFEHPNAKALLKKYLNHHPLSGDGQLKMMDLDDATEFVAIHLEKGYYLWFEAREKWNKKMGKKIF